MSAETDGGTIVIEQEGGNVTMNLTKYLKGLGFDIPQHNMLILETVIEPLWRPSSKTRFDQTYRTRNDSTISPKNDFITLAVFLERIEIKSQRLYFNHFGRFLNPHPMYLDVPKQHLPKLSRLKTHHNFLNLSDFPIQFLTTIFSYKFEITFIISNH